MFVGSADPAPVGAGEWLTAPVLRAAVRAVVKPILSPAIPIVWQRWWLTCLALSTLTAAAEVVPGAVGGVAGEWLRPRRRHAATNAAATAQILYLHGGGYCIGSPATHRAITSRLARAAALPVFVADYRLAPEHAFPAACDDALAAYRALAAAGPVVIAGDSAGGGLALATALAVRALAIEPPAALVLFSPWVDLSLDALADRDAEREAMLSVAWLAACADHYLAGQPATAVSASPIYGDLRGLPPTFIQTGADELLYADTVRLHDALARAGVAVRCEIVPARWHVFQLHAGILPSADAAIARAGGFIGMAIGRRAEDGAQRQQQGVGRR